MRDLTEKQRVVYNFLAAFILEKGFPPTLREISKRIGRTPNSARLHLSALIKKGWLRKEAAHSRALTLLGPPAQPESETLDVIEGLIPAMRDKGFRLVRTF